MAVAPHFLCERIIRVAPAVRIRRVSSDKHLKVIMKKALVMAHWPPPLTQRKGASHADRSREESIRRFGPAQTQCVLWSHRPGGPADLPPPPAGRVADDLAGARSVSPAVESRRGGVHLQLVLVGRRPASGGLPGASGQPGRDAAVQRVETDRRRNRRAVAGGDVATGHSAAQATSTRKRSGPCGTCCAAACSSGVRPHRRC